MNQLNKAYGLLRGKKIAILGAGPTGLDAAHRLAEIGEIDFQLYEQTTYPGGLAAYSKMNAALLGISDVLFSYYGYFDHLVDELLGDEWLHHQREFGTPIVRSINAELSVAGSPYVCPARFVYSDGDGFHPGA